MKNTKVRITISVTCENGSFDTKTVFSTERSQGGDLSLREIRQCGVNQTRDALAKFKEQIEDMEMEEAAKIEKEEN